MKTIYKYQLIVTDIQCVWMPKGAEILSVADQGGSLVLWALCDPSAPSVARNLRIVGTGHMTENAGRFIGTVLQAGGALVWHVFESC